MEFLQAQTSGNGISKEKSYTNKSSGERFKQFCLDIRVDAKTPYVRSTRHNLLHQSKVTSRGAISGKQMAWLRGRLRRVNWKAELSLEEYYQKTRNLLHKRNLS